MVEVVRVDEDGRITGVLSDETRYAEPKAELARSRAAALLPTTADDRHPLLTAVLPDNDGVLRARWRTDQTPADVRWAFLRTLRRGQVRKGVASRIAPFGVFVELGGAEGLVRIPEVSWDRIGHPGEVVAEGQEVAVVVIDVDMDRELVSLSTKALREKPSTPPC
ncbi:S1 RNA-binding domain-containing protein [Streptomyces sp. A5-4]|uniref:S1 RNA-binding domain-containing protein n=1 Tax=Streptomyces sp. A5-4 TaxID=3384771 RepID=UPI003DA7BCED